MFIASSTRLRYVTFWLARLWGYVYRWLLSGWRPFVLWLILVASAVWLAEQGAVRLHLFNVKPGGWFQVWNILAVYALFGILGYAWQARKRIVVEEFVDYAAVDASKPIAKGLATLLVIKLAQLRELYQAVDEQRAIPTNVGVNSSLDATINVEDVSGFLKGAVSPESKLSLGPIAIPVGNLMSLVSRLVQGTRITGSLHRSTRDGKAILILTAQKVGGARAKSWQVDSEIIPPVKDGEPEKYKFDDMAIELAYRIFADLELGGTVRVKALSIFSEGLQAYRDCLRTPKDRKPNLKLAQRRLIEALAEDINFDVAYYNLGVVYSELDQKEAAEVTFWEAIKRNPHAWSAYYALMVHHFRCEQNESAIQLCERVIDLKPGRLNLAKAYLSIGLARRRLKDLRGAIKSHKKAVFHAWKALCAFERSRQRTARTPGSPLPHLELVVSVCLANLAIAYGYKARIYHEKASKSKSTGLGYRIALFQRWYTFRRARGLFRQALFLNRSNADFSFELGKLCYERQKYKQAVRAYERAVQIYPEKIELWAHLALACARLKPLYQDVALKACQKVQDNASYAFETALEAFEKTKEAYNWLKESEQGKRVAAMPAFLQGLKKDVQQGEDGISTLEKKLLFSELEHDLWKYAQISWALGQVYLNIDKPKDAETWFLTAIDKFKTVAPSEVRLRRLRALLARALLNQQKYDEALREAEKAIALDPLNSFEREVLGDAYHGLDEFERAVDAWQAAILRRHSETYIIYYKMGIAYRQLAQQCHTAQRTTFYQRATASLEQALDLCESDQQGLKAQASYFLGSIHIERGAYEEAIACFRISKSLSFAPQTSTFYLAYAYLRNKEYDASTDLFQSLGAELEKAKKKGKLNTASNAHSQVENLTLDEMLVMTYCSLAFSYAERDIQLNEGLQFIKKAQQHMNTLDQEKLKAFRFRASYMDCKGWLLTKQGKTDEAIKCLEQALALSTGAETYWHLAAAHMRKLQDCSKDDPQAPSLSMQAKVYCQHVQELDLNKEFEQRVQDLLQSLKERENAQEQGHG